MNACEAYEEHSTLGAASKDHPLSCGGLTVFVRELAEGRVRASIHVPPVGCCPWADPYKGFTQGFTEDSSEKAFSFFYSSQLSLKIIQSRSKHIRWFWTHMLALAGSHQTLLTCPWSSYLYQDQVQVLFGSSFRSSVANPGHILHYYYYNFYYYYFIIIIIIIFLDNDFQAKHTWKMIGTLQVGPVPCVSDLPVWYFPRHAELHAESFSGKFLWAPWMWAAHLFQQGRETWYVVNKDNTGCDRQSVWSALPQVSSALCRSRQQDSSERWSTNPSIFCPPGISRSSSCLQAQPALRCTVETGHHQKPSQRTHLWVEMSPLCHSPTAGREVTAAPHSGGTDAILSPAKHQRMSPRKLHWICCFDFLWPPST